MTTYDRVIKMRPYTKNEWIENARLYGLACTCKSGYCAKHDARLQALINNHNVTNK